MSIIELLRFVDDVLALNGNMKVRTLFCLQTTFELHNYPSFRLIGSCGFVESGFCLFVLGFRCFLRGGGGGSCEGRV